MSKVSDFGITVSLLMSLKFKFHFYAEIIVWEFFFEHPLIALNFRKVEDLTVLEDIQLSPLKNLGQIYTLVEV
jgi:hypothetical protein